MAVKHDAPEEQMKDDWKQQTRLYTLCETGSGDMK
jgi:hypothetical protein